MCMAETDDRKLMRRVSALRWAKVGFGRYCGFDVPKEYGRNNAATMIRWGCWGWSAALGIAADA